MKHRTVTILLVTALILTTFTAIFRIPPVQAPAGGTVWVIPVNFPTLEAAMASGLIMNNDEIHINPGHVETLTMQVVIPQNDLWIIGPPPGLGPTPTINVNGFSISILGANVFIWGLNFIDTTGSSVGIIKIAPSATNTIIMRNTITGSQPPNIGIEAQGTNGIIALNQIGTNGICIEIAGPAFGNTIKLNTINPPLILGIQLISFAVSNAIYWNNIFMAPEFWDAGPPGSPPNYFDDTTTPGGPGFNKGNHWVSMPMAPAPIPGPGINGWFDWFPQAAPVLVLPGDVDLNGRIDIFDIVVVALHFSEVWSQLGWDPRADINGDGVVDIFDIVTVALNFGGTY